MTMSGGGNPYSDPKGDMTRGVARSSRDGASSCLKTRLVGIPVSTRGESSGPAEHMLTAGEVSDPSSSDMGASEWIASSLSKSTSESIPRTVLRRSWFRLLSSLEWSSEEDCTAA